MLKRAAVVYNFSEEKTKSALASANLLDWFESRKWRMVALRIVIVLLAFELTVGLSGAALMLWLVRTIVKFL